jgi:hypothetical protein
VQRVEFGDTPASLAKRYGTVADALIAANRDGLPSTGQFVAIPVSYPGEKPAATAKRTAAALNTHSAGSPLKKPTVASVVTGQKTTQSAQKKEAPRKPATVAAQKATAKTTLHRIPGA